ncbi:phospholipase D-like domain-containing protein [[Kitasatospora] papulosa]|uniref:hypothetical protein n=1 Tax=[Kitasatospora] papulosa TaxID=1464011 RepID=UPI0036A645B5
MTAVAPEAPSPDEPPTTRLTAVPPLEPEPREPEPVDEPEPEPVGEPEPERLPAFAMPELRQYADPKAVVDLARQGAKASRKPAAVLGRGLLAAAARAGRGTLTAVARIVRLVLTGTRVLLGLLVGWMTGQHSKSGSVAARFGGVAALLYVLARTAAAHPAETAATAAGVWFLAAVLAARGAFDGLVKKAKAKTAKGDAKPGEKTAPKPGNPEEKTAPKPEEKTPAQDVEKTGERPRKGLAGWLRKKPAPAPADAPAQAPANAPAEAVQEPPLTALIRELIGDDNGVHLSTLRPAIRERFPAFSQASDKRVRELLVGEGWDPSRTFRAGGVAGRAGIHRDQLPPLPSPDDGQEAERIGSPPPKSASDLAVSPRSPEAESGGERGRRAPERATEKPPEGWTAEDVSRGYRWVNDIERGPSAWVIQRREDVDG